jgi:chitodextrinase
MQKWACVLTAILFAAGAGVAQAAGPSVTDARISGGKLIVAGKATAGAVVRLEGIFSVTAGADGTYRFSVVNVPRDCIADLATVAAPTEITRAAIANCGVATTRWRGPWAGSTLYAAGDLVTYLGSTFLARRATQNDIPVSATADWSVFAARGATGPAGATGPQGPGFRHRGAWAAGTAYSAGDIAELGGSAWLALRANTGRNPGFFQSELDWRKFASGMKFRGVWDAAIAYNADDTVRFDGSLYQSTSSGLTGFTPTGGIGWKLLASKGDAGPAGPVNPMKLDCVNTSSASASIQVGGTTTIFSPSCSTEYNLIGGSCSSDALAADVYMKSTQMDTSEGRYYCSFKNNSSSPHTLYAYARCCRVPAAP